MKITEKFKQSGAIKSVVVNREEYNLRIIRRGVAQLYVELQKDGMVFGRGTISAYQWKNWNNGRRIYFAFEK